jgi:hypothetical protein
VTVSLRQAAGITGWTAAAFAMAGASSIWTLIARRWQGGFIGAWRRQLEALRQNSATRTWQTRNGENYAVGG